MEALVVESDDSSIPVVVSSDNDSDSDSVILVSSDGDSDNSATSLGRPPPKLR